MSRHDDFMTDPAFLKAVEGASAGLTLMREMENPDPNGAARLLAMMVLVAFTNQGGLTEPHVGRLARFAPDLGQDDAAGNAGLADDIRGDADARRTRLRDALKGPKRQG